MQQVNKEQGCIAVGSIKHTVKIPRHVGAVNIWLEAQLLEIFDIIVVVTNCFHDALHMGAECIYPAATPPHSSSIFPCPALLAAAAAGGDMSEMNRTWKE
jgi:hypothetical protein